MVTAFFLALVSGYALGSISFSYHAGKLLQGIDLREHGSGNLGSTNTMRVLGKKPGFTVQGLDILKGVASLWLAAFWCDQLGVGQSAALACLLVAGVAAVLGHMFPFYLQFKGGKGVNTALGIFLYLTPTAVFAVLVIFLIAYKVTGYVSVGSLLAAVGLPLVLLVQKYWLHKVIPASLLLFACAVSVLIVLMHRSNITRLLQGTENSVNHKKV